MTCRFQVAATTTRKLQTPRLVPGLALIFANLAVATAGNGENPLKVFILAGQSNMEGQGAIRTLDWLGEDERYGRLLEKIKNKDGSWAVREDVWIYYPRARGGPKKGNLSVGYGARDDRIVLGQEGTRARDEVLDQAQVGR